MIQPLLPYRVSSRQWPPSGLFFFSCLSLSAAQARGTHPLPGASAMVWKSSAAIHMTTTDTQNDNLRMYVNDTAAMARHIEGAFAQQKEDKDVQAHAAVRELIERMHGILASQRKAMEQHAEEAGGGVGAALKEAVTSVTGALAGLYGKVRKHPLSRILRDNYTAISLACVAYEMLHTTALGLGRQALADTALAHIKQLAPLIMSVTKIIPEVVLQELAADDPAIDVSVAGKAVENTLGAWCASESKE